MRSRGPANGKESVLVAWLDDFTLDLESDRLANKRTTLAKEL